MKASFISACQRNDTSSVRELLSRGADVNWRNDLDMRMAGLHYAARSNYGELLELLLDQTGVDVNITNNYCRTPLIWACSRGHDAIVRRLSLVSNIEYNCRDLWGRSALHHAVYHNKHACVWVLRGTGALHIDWNMMSDYGECPLVIAIYQGYPDILQTILSVPQLDLSVVDNRVRNVAQIAVEELREGSKCLELLIGDPRVNWNIKSRAGDTPLEYCIMMIFDTPHDVFQHCDSGI